MGMEHRRRKRKYPNGVQCQQCWAAGLTPAVSIAYCPACRSRKAVRL
jgi:Zn finger protein HypA/HybF involved in hydrogenase expression